MIRLPFSNVKPTAKFIWHTLRHKYYVFRAGLHTKAPIWNLLVHDWTKFTVLEATGYGRSFYGDKSDPIGYMQAWLHHQNKNPHHWSYWIPREGSTMFGYPDNQPIPMPEKYVREMVADWLGATRAWQGKWPPNVIVWKWLNENVKTFDMDGSRSLSVVYGRYSIEESTVKLHPDTFYLVRKVIEEVFGHAPNSKHYLAR